MSSTSSILEFLAQDFTRADLIALAALGVAGLSVLYARRQANEARKTRLSAEREARRPQRLEIFRELEDYCRYCSTYYTLYLLGTVPGTRDLVARIETLKVKMDQGAIFDMPEVVGVSNNVQAMGWRMQRHLDRIGQQSSSPTSATAVAKDVTAVEDLVDSFAKQRSELNKVFAPYLLANKYT